MTARSEQLLKDYLDEKFNTFQEKLNNVETSVRSMEKTINGNGKPGLIDRMQALETFKTELVAKVGVFMILGWIAVMIFGNYIQKAVAAFFGGR